MSVIYFRNKKSELFKTINGYNLLNGGRKKMVKEKKCPLNLSEWIHYLSTETTLKRYDYYNEEVSTLTITIVSLMIINGLFMLFTITNDFQYLDAETKFAGLISISFIFLFLIGIIVLFVFRLIDKKSKMNNTIEALADIICSIINGELKDTNKIRKKYMDIWPDEDN